MDTELCFTGARKLAQMIRARHVSATEVVRAYATSASTLGLQVEPPSRDSSSPPPRVPA